MARYTITYLADDASMGETSPEDCAAFRRWAQAEIARAYPEHEVTVGDEVALDQVRTDDEARREEIVDFCARLWDRCPWDWMDA